MECATSFKVTDVREVVLLSFSLFLLQPDNVAATRRKARSRAKGFLSIFFIITSK